MRIEPLNRFGHSAFQAVCQLFPLSRRERAGVRENHPHLCGGEFKFRNPQSPIRNRKSGMALVVTLILLSVTLVMAVAFLAISRRERNSVATTTDTTTAQLAADDALAQAENRIVSTILATTNPYVSPLIVSTNYYNAAGFDPTASPNPTNVNYNYLINNGGPLANVTEFDQNIANLFYSPRPPVYSSNLLYNTYDLQFYLDLNRNGRYDTNGWVVDENNLGTTNGLGGYSLEVGDPEWIGVLEHPDAPHGPNNPFVARYCFIAVPANSLDLNHIHNQVLNTSLNPAQDGYFRDQGIGPWEMNLAAFLADLNSDVWDPLGAGNQYEFLQPGTFNTGAAFQDAFYLTSWRYANNYGLLGSANSLYGAPGAFAFQNDGIDWYGNLGRQITFDTNYLFADIDPNTPWAGADNTNNYFYSPSELFNSGKTSIPFTTRLYNVGTSNATYDRYTFYRMLSQLGTDTAPESGKINLNYQNAVVNYDGNGVPTSIAVVPNMETNFINWRPQDFFTAAANTMLQAYSAEWYELSPSNYLQSYYGYRDPLYLGINGFGVTNGFQYFGGQVNQIPSFGVTNIPVYVNGVFTYTPAINRVLQLAANIYDASTNSEIPNVISNNPSVFRPVFWTTNEFSFAEDRYYTNVYIRGYLYTPYATNGIFDPIFSQPVEATELPIGICTSNVWGVPWILGAKKGMPNLNQVEVENNFFIERALQFTRSSADPSGGTFPYGRTYSTNQMYIIGVNNYFGGVDWNSYDQRYNLPVHIFVRNTLSLGLTWTNDDAAGNPIRGNSVINTIFGSTNFTVLPWEPYAPVTLLGTNAFVYTLTAGGSTVPYVNANGGIPFLLNPANQQWTTNADFVFYYGPGSQSFSGYPFTGPDFIPTAVDPPNFLDTGTPPLPQMTLYMTNRLQAIAVDNSGGILDYVQLGGMDNAANINQAIADETRGYPEGLWSTNGYEGGTMPYGIYEQYLVSKIGGSVPSEDNDGGTWANTPVPGTTDTGQAAQQAFFSAFFSPSSSAPYANAAGGNVENTNLSMQAPFTPTRVASERFVYAANDPLVHYMTSDLIDTAGFTNNLGVDNPPLSKLSALSDRYAPWGKIGNSTAFGGFTPDQNAYNLSYKDPLVTVSDNWDFPTNKYPSVGWLGRVHRGTPWQTVYLKSTNVLDLAVIAGGGAGARVISTGLTTWMPWTGDIYNAYDAVNMAPVQDRLLFDLFTAAPDDDAMRGQLNVNIGADDVYNPFAGLASWSALLSGMNAFSNNVPHKTMAGVVPSTPPFTESPIGSETYPPFTSITVQPYSVAPAFLGEIVQSINGTRTNYSGIGGLHVFEHVGDVLAAPALSDGSPFLDLTYQGNVDPAQLKFGISDEMYEWLPQQAMGLLTVSGTPQSPPRYVVYCYGQTLKPAPNGLVTSGPFFGLCTNYQVVAETAARAIIRVDNAPNPANPTATPHVVIEQYNPLPPD